MKASIVDIRYKMKEILHALDHNEAVTVLYHGKEKGIIQPIKNKNTVDVCNHPFFGQFSNSSSNTSVDKQIEDLRELRY